MLSSQLFRHAAYAVALFTVTALGGYTSAYANAPGFEPLVTEKAAARFLGQSSFGPTAATIARVQQIGFNAYIDEQFDLPSSAYGPLLEGDMNMAVLEQRFFRNALTGKDQLRQRMAFALGQIFVVSSENVPYIEAIMTYQNALLRSAFGNYHDLLRTVTLHPAMGEFLDMVNNAASDSPNENFARELMQLFTIGPTLLYLNGTEKRDAYGNHIASYSQQQVEGIARALTGWTYPTRPGDIGRPINPRHFFGPMIPVYSLHDYEKKVILRGTVIPAGQTPQQDVDSVLSAIFSHPNVGPFLAKRLIQNFVTSNPSPNYVRRVALAFNDNGNGTRGDLRAVIKAILLDPEARRGDDPQYTATRDGKLKEPILFITGALRTLNARSTSYNLNSYASAMGQNLFSAPTVFNYFPPEHRIHGTALNGPEFKLRNSTSIVALTTFVHRLVYGHAPDEMAYDLSNWVSLAHDTNLLLDTIDRRFMHGTMSYNARSSIASALNTQHALHTTIRAQMALYLALTSSQYAIQR